MQLATGSNSAVALQRPLRNSLMLVRIGGTNANMNRVPHFNTSHLSITRQHIAIANAQIYLLYSAPVSESPWRRVATKPQTRIVHLERLVDRLSNAGTTRTADRLNSSNSQFVVCSPICHTCGNELTGAARLISANI